MSGTPATSRRRVVILGGGFGGATLARALEDTFDVVLVDTKDFFENTSGVFKVFADPAAVPPQVLQQSHTAYLSQASFVFGQATEVTPASVTVNLYESAAAPGMAASLVLPYDMLAICTGVNYNCRLTKERNVTAATKVHWLLHEAAALANCKSVAVIGGGTSGCELAANLAARHPHIAITVIEARSDGVMHSYGDRAAMTASDVLRRLGVRIVAGIRVTSATRATAADGCSSDQFVVSSATGPICTVDRVYSCTGGFPNSDFMRKNMPFCLDDRGFIKVNSYMQVEGGGGYIFAAGDVTNIPEEKLATRALVHSGIIAKNMKALASGAPMRKSLAPVRDPYMCVSFGLRDAIVMESGDVLATGNKAATMKSKMDTLACRLLPKTEPLRRFIRTYGLGRTSNSISRNSEANRNRRIVFVRGYSSSLSVRVAQSLLTDGYEALFATMAGEIAPGINKLSGLAGPVRMVQDLQPDALGPLFVGCYGAVLPLWPRLGLKAADLDAAATVDPFSDLLQFTRSFCQCAISSLVPHVVVLAPTASQAASSVLSSLEECIRVVKEWPNLSWTIIRYQLDFKNALFHQTVESIQLHRTLILPLDPSSRYAFMWLDPKDLVACVHAVIAQRIPFFGKDIELTGPEVLNQEACVRAVADVIEENVMFESLSSESTQMWLGHQGYNQWESALIAASGYPADAAKLTSHVKTILGRDPLTFSQFATSRRATLLAGGQLSVDVDELLKDSEALKSVICAASESGHTVHRELAMSDLSMMHLISSGSFGDVYRAQFMEATVAVKVIRSSNDEEYRRVFRHEIAFMSLLRHPNLVTCIGAVTSGPQLAIVFEFVHSGSLEAFLGVDNDQPVLPLPLQLRMAKDIARACRFLHGHGIVHGDIKPGNILVGRHYQLKLTDFDTCRINLPKMSGLDGTMLYMAPEKMSGKSYTNKVDVFSFAVTVWQLVTRKFPYAEIPDKEALIKAVVKGTRPTPDVEKDHPLSKLIKKCWKSKAEKRPSFEECYQQIEEIIASSPLMQERLYGEPGLQGLM